MSTAILSAGLACIIAAVVGGGLKAFDIEIPALKSLLRQVILGVLGVLLIFVSMHVNSGNSAAAQTSPSAPPAQQAAAQPTVPASTRVNEERSILRLTYEGDANQCGGGTSQRIRLNETTSFTVSKDCVSGGTLHWIRRNGSEETFALGSESSPGGEVALIGPPQTQGADLIYSYKVVR
ncbi:MAG TPA: hypothetical protein VMU71_01425 [Terracidiphilus sp.]|nr:hypothetical protein [Terracidiphilus sp.]